MDEVGLKIEEERRRSNRKRKKKRKKALVKKNSICRWELEVGVNIHRPKEAERWPLP